MKIQSKPKFTAILLAVLFLFASSIWSSDAYANRIPEKSNRFVRFIKVWSKKIGKAAQVAGPVVTVLGRPDIGEPLGIGGKVLVAIDPAPGIFLDGRITVQFDSSLVALDSEGWFGDWGIDPALPAPALDPPPEGTPWTLQAPNSSLTSSITFPSADTIQVDWDWGIAGHAALTSDHFNFFGLEFTALANTTFDALDAAITLPGNIYLVGEGAPLPTLQINHCTPRTGGIIDPIDGGVIIELCGTEEVPEPSTYILFATGLLGIIGYSWRKRKLNKYYGPNTVQRSRAMKKSNITRLVLGSLVLLLWTSSIRTAQATPLPVPGLINVTYDFTEDLDSFSLVLQGGPIITIQFRSLTLGTFWPIELVFLLARTSATVPEDGVSLTGTVFHRAEPHPPEGEGAGLQFDYALLGNEEALLNVFHLPHPPEGEGEGLEFAYANGEALLPSPAVRNHGDHSDVYTLSATFTASPPHIELWQVNLSGVHVPEPSSILLIGTGLLIAITANIHRRSTARKKEREL